MILYPEQIILEHETCLHAYEVFEEYEFNKLDMSLDVINKVGPRGHYLREKHTRAHIRDFRYSRLLRKVDEHGDPRPPRDVALEEFKKIYATHRPEPLPDRVLGELDRIVAAADREAEKLGA